MSGIGAARITAPGNMRCSTQSSAVPVSDALAWGGAGPVAKTNVAPFFITLRRRSVIPGSSSRWYTRFRFQPSAGLTWIAERCQDTFTSPAAGDSTTWRASPVTALAPPPPPPPPPPPGISSITSLNWMTASPFKSGTTVPDSGATLTICGGALSGGPPGGSPGLAQPPPPPPASSAVRSSRAT